MTLNRALSLAFLLAFPFGCSRPTNLSGNPATPYHKLESSLTREARFIGLEKVRYLTSITYKSRELREAYVNEYARRYGLSSEEKEKLLKNEMEEAGRFDAFLVSHFATDRDTSKVTREPKVWRLTLISDGNEAAPSDPDSVASLASNDTVLRYFYPQVTSWSKVFLVQFKHQGDPSHLKLKMVGVVDDLSFDWQLRK